MKFFKILFVLMCIFFFITIPAFSENGYTNELTIVNADSSGHYARMSKTLELFEQMHPETKVVFKEIMDGRILVTALMSGDPDYDIIFTNDHDGICSRVMAKAGAIKDLSKYQTIKENYDKWVDMGNTFYYDDMLFGVPDMVFPYVWSVNTGLLDKLSIAIPDDTNWTWEDFFDIGQIIMEYNSANNTSYYLLSDFNYPYILLEYDANYVDFFQGMALYDTAYYRTLMDRWRACEVGGLIFQLDELYKLAENALFYVSPIMYYELGDGTYVMPPKFSEDTMYPLYVSTVVLNNSTDCIDSAVDFISLYISPETFATDHIIITGLFLKDLTVYSEAQLQASDIADLPSEKNNQYWLNLLKNGTQDFLYGDLQRLKILDLYPKFMAGEISVDTYASKVQDQADLVLGE